MFLMTISRKNKRLNVVHFTKRINYKLEVLLLVESLLRIRIKLGYLVVE